MRVLILALAGLAAACTIDGPEPGSTDMMAQLERQERIRRQAEERQRLCQILDRDSERYERDCERAGDRR